MSIHRVRIAKDKAELVQSLVDRQGTSAPFQTYADVLVFAASLGAKEGKKRPLQEIAKEPAPISLEIFISRGYAETIALLAVTDKEDINLLAIGDDRIEAMKVAIFEEYVNGGLEKLREELRGAVDYTDRLLLSIGATRYPENSIDTEFDLSRFL
jgi:dnd system-associated protein 4